MNAQKLAEIVSKIKEEGRLFAKKSYLDPLSLPTKIIGREKQAEQLVRYLSSHDQGFVVPLIATYGRSGSGKSTITRFVCENLDGIASCFVNLRKAKTVFGCVNLILAELGQPNLKSAQGLNAALEKIGAAIEAVLQKEKKKLFVLILDEFDVLFFDKRSKPSDFVYKLITLEESLRQKGYLMTIITISNNVLSDYELDDRVRSRIGTSEIFFEAYSNEDILKILRERAKEAFATKIDDEVLVHCANLSFVEHGDARRAIDLLRVASEIASRKGEQVLKKHVELASKELQKDRVVETLATSSHHFKLAAVALAWLTYFTGTEWHATSSLYKKYCEMLPKDTQPLTNRRVSELLTDLVNTGLATSQTLSKGRHGYGTQYKLTVLPETVGNACFPDWWKKTMEEKQKQDEQQSQMSMFEIASKSDSFYQLYKTMQSDIKEKHKEVDRLASLAGKQKSGSSSKTS